jgi:hypothetical protein
MNSVTFLATVSIAKLFTSVRICTIYEQVMYSFVHGLELFFEEILFTLL